MKHVTYRLFTFACIATALVMSVRSFAQDTTANEHRARFGAFAGVGFTHHAANFEQLPGVPNCGTIFSSGSGIGPNLGVFYTMPVGTDLGVSIRGLYVSSGGKFIANEHFPLSVNGSFVAANDEHSLDATLNSLALQPILQYEFIRNLSAYAGMQLSYVLSTSFDQIETLTSPASGVFTENRLRTRNPQSGAIPDVNKFGISLVMGIGYSLPMNSSGTLHAIPQAFISFGLNPVVSGINWHTMAFVAGVGIEYTPPKSAPPPPPPVIIPPPPPPLPAAPAPLAVSIRATGLSDDGTETPNVSVVVEELYAKNMSPILPFVFFDTASASIPERMHLLSRDQAKAFDINKVTSSNALKTHAEMLNIIGSRLVAAPKALVTLTGVIHGNTPTELARQRAAHVRDYLVKTWGIDAKRITIQTQPSSVATNFDSDIVAEEHRVEIQSTEPSLLDPLTTYDTIRTAQPPALRIYPNATNMTQNGNWEIIGKQQNQILARWSASDSTLPNHLDWTFARGNVPKYPGSLELTIRIGDSLGRSATASMSIPLEQLTLGRKKSTLVAGRTIERYNLIVFDRGSSVLTSHHKRLNDQIRKQIKPNSDVSVIGYTDRVGEAAFNQRLSEDRAQAVAKSLGVGPNATVKGIGETQDLYSNELPEGRFFCRTVVVTIETQEKTP